MKTWIVSILTAGIWAGLILYVVLVPPTVLIKPASEAPVVTSPSQIQLFIDYIPPHVDKPIEVGATFIIKSCKILDGFEFSVLLENDQWINIRLPIVTKEGVSNEVFETMKSDRPPVVVLKRKIGNYWIADFELSIAGKKVTLVEVLREKHLTL